MDTTIKLNLEAVAVNPDFMGNDNTGPAIDAGDTETSSADAEISADAELVKATFRLAGAVFRNTLALGKLHGDQLDDELKARVCLQVLPTKLSCVMERKSVSTRATIGFIDETAKVPADGVAFELLLIQAARIATRTASTKQTIVMNGNEGVWTVEETPGSFQLNLAVAKASEELLKPWQPVERTLVCKFDPEALRMALAYVASISPKTGLSPHAVVEVSGGVARGSSMTTVALVSGDALAEVNFCIMASDVVHACRVLGQMDAKGVELWSAAEYQYIVSDHLELAIKTPAISPAITSRIVAMVPNNPIALHFDPLLLGAMAARPLGGKNVNLDLQLRQLGEDKLLLTAQSARGRFAHVSPRVASVPEGTEGSEPEGTPASEQTSPDFDALLSRDDKPLAMTPHRDFEKLLFAMPDPDAVTLDVGKRSLSIESSAKALRFRAYVPTVESLE